METIIVGTDYSRAADNALKYAASLASSLKGSIVLFNAFFLPVFPVTLLDIQWLIQENKIRLKTLADEIIDQYGVNVKTVTGTSLLLEELDELVKKWDAELVILGMHGDSPGRKFLGNTATSVLKHASYPVLIVPAEVQFNKPTKILFACDNAAYMIDSSLSFIKELSQVLELNLEVLNVIRGKDYISADGMSTDTEPLKIEKVFKTENIIYEEIFEEDMIEVVSQKLEESGADLLIIMPATSYFWNKLFNLPKVDKLIQHFKVPLLILPYQMK